MDQLIKAEGISAKRLARAAGLAALLGVIGNGLLYAFGVWTGMIDERVLLPSLLGMTPVSFGSVAVTTVFAMGGAALLLTGLSVITRHPIRIFRIVATLLALGSLSMPATIAGPPASMRLALGAMHVLAWAATIGVLATLAGKDQGGAA